MTQKHELWQQLLSAAQCVQSVQEGQSITQALTKIPPELKAAAQSISFQTLRTLEQSNKIIEHLAHKKPAPIASALLCITISLLKDKNNQEEQTNTYEEHTLVHQTVKAAKNKRLPQASVSFINAILRTYLRDKQNIQKQAWQASSAKYNHPQWWIDQVEKDYPDNWQQILESSQIPAPMILRLNPAYSNPEEFIKKLNQAGIKAKHIAANAIELEKPVNVEKIPDFDKGSSSVQSFSAQQAVPLLLEKHIKSGIKELKILDACAAPGGKTAHILELCAEHGIKAQVLALEKDPKRAALISQNLKRLSLDAQIKIASAQNIKSWNENQEKYDAILLDAPCSASGIGARHPDIRWLRRPSDIEKLAQEQQHLLNALEQILKSGGLMLYATCSIFKTEGEKQIEKILNKKANQLKLLYSKHLLPQTKQINAENQKMQMLQITDAKEKNVITDDGFYYALLEKQ